MRLGYSTVIELFKIGNSYAIEKRNFELRSTSIYQQTTIPSRAFYMYSAPLALAQLVSILEAPRQVVYWQRNGHCVKSQVL